MKSTSKSDKKTDCLDKLAEGVKALTDSESWKSYLRQQAKFHRYSFNNSIMILVQCRNATRVAGYKAWQALGRQVRKGEKGIVIFTPRPFVKKNKDGEEEQGMTFGTASVFDFGQTDPIEGFEHPFELRRMEMNPMGTADEALEGLWNFGLRKGFAVEYGEPGAGAWGCWNASSNTLLLRKGGDSGNLVMVLAHELAHALLGHAGSADGLPTDVKELEAQSVAFVVCEALGVDASEFSFEYLARWSGQETTARIKAAGPRIQKTAHEILAAIQPE